MSITMYDAIPELIGRIPAKPQAVAGYVNGRYAWSASDWARFPGAEHLTISVNSQGNARALDIEAGDAAPEDAPGWLLHHADHSHGLPVLYCSASAVASVLAALTTHGIGRGSVLIWSAHYGKGKHICGPKTCGFPQADGTQHTDTAGPGGSDLDESLLSDRFFAKPPPPPHGKANFHGSYDLATGHWTIIPDKGAVVFDHIDRWASAELQVNVRTGHWRVRNIPWNSPPLGH